MEILQNTCLISAVLAWAVAQLCKLLIELIAHHRLDWERQFSLALDPEKAERFYNQVPPSERHQCSMCCKMCAVRTTNLILEGKKIAFCSEKGAC